MSVYRLTLLAILAALGVVGRSLFVFLPNVQPVTAIIIIAGIILGPFSAFILAFLITFLSNMLLGMGIWTVWQVISWGIIVLLIGIIGNIFKSIQIYMIAFLALFCGYLYGFIISLNSSHYLGRFIPNYI